VLVVTGLLAAAPPRPAGRRRFAVLATGLVLLLFAPLVIVRGLEWRDTSTLLHATVRDNPDAPRVMYLNALDLRDRGRVPESLAACRRLLRRLPRFADAWHLAGRNCADLGRDTEALQAFERAVDLARRPDPAWLNDYAVALIRNGRRDEALPVLEQALERDPGDPRAAENRAQLLLLRPETRDRGLAALRDLVGRHPGEASAWVLLVEAELASGRTAEAAAAARRARTALADERVSAFLDARLIEGRGEREAAARAYRDLLARRDLDPSLRRRAQAALGRVTP
jgi:predicted Zn-dependent protease